MSRFIPILLVFLQLQTSVGGDELSLRASQPRKLLVLNSGRVYGGQLVSRQDGYDVILPNGRIYVSGDRIRFLASSMQEAYDRMSASVQNKTPTTHFEMAKWCLTYGLKSHARRELLDALHLNPDFGAAHKLLESLTRERKRHEQSTKSASSILTDMAAQKLGVVERRSLGGLPPEAARTFTLRVQSIVSNKCGNSSCHGGSSNEFQFTTTRRSSSVATTEANLAAVLKQLDLTQPAESPFLLKAQQIHGGARNPYFRGQAGRTQLQLLKDWVHGITPELSPSHPSALKAVPSKLQRQDEGAGMIVQASYEEVESSPIPIDGVRIQRRSKAETDSKFQQASRIAVRSDPFDPMIFNRRYHGRVPSSR